MRYLVVLGLLLGSTLPTALALANGVTERVSVDNRGREGDANSFGGDMSASGRFVVFLSEASNLVQGDRNDIADVFVRDRRTNKTTRVNVSSSGAEANDESGFDHQAISADGRFVTFDSGATNLVPDDTNGSFDVFVHDRLTGRTTRVSVASNGSQANGGSNRATISANGRFVCFNSFASNLVADDTNNGGDFFVHDRLTGVTTLVSLSSSGSQGIGDSFGGASLSADGRIVAFASGAPGLVPGDTNDRIDIFVRDRKRGTTERISVGPGGTQVTDAENEEPALSADGNRVVYVSGSAALVAGDTNGVADIFVYDRRQRRAVLASPGPGGVPATGGLFGSFAPSISPDGWHVGFTSDATNLVRGDTNGQWDVFVRDLATGRTQLVSVGPGGAPGNADSGARPGLSADGRFVSFGSGASNLVRGDSNDAADVFIRDRGD